MESNASVAKQANRLYWRTAESVGDIAEKLSVSRRALYELITPESTGSTCSACGGDVVYANRSAKTAKLGRCQKCGTESAVTEDDNHVLDVQETVPPYAAGWPRMLEKPSSSENLRHRALALGGVALAGVALGTLAAVLVTRRR